VEGGEIRGRHRAEHEARGEDFFAHGVGRENGEGGAHENGAGGWWFCGLLVGHYVSCDGELVNYIQCLRRVGLEEMRESK
jgi:hypothetical protein